MNQLLGWGKRAFYFICGQEFLSLVGGIGVMKHYVVSLTERTPENIGIRKSLGGRRPIPL